MNEKLILLIACVFVLISAVYASNIEFFGSPDESTNLFFIREYAKTGNIYYEDSLNLELNGTLHPRSGLAEGTRVFLGGSNGIIIYYGGIESIIHNFYKIASPILIIISVIFLYLSLSLFITRKRAAIIASFIFVNYIILYWFAKPLMNNSLSTTFLIAGFYYFSEYHYTKKIKFGFLSALLFITAVLTRYELLVLLGVSFLVYAVLERKKIKKKFIICYLLMALVLICTLFLITLESTGGFLPEGPRIASSPLEESGAIRALRIGELILVPSGFNLELFFKNSYNYLFIFFLPLSIVFLISIKSLFKIKKYNSLYWFVLIFCLYSLFYYMSGVYYGLDPIEIGASYLRYNLPVLIAIISFSINSFLNNFSKNYALTIISILIVLSVLSYNQVYSNLYRSISYQQNLEEVEKIIPSNAIILTHGWDKIVFPKYRVLTFAQEPLYNNTNPIFHAQLLEKSWDLGYETYFIYDRNYFNVNLTNSALTNNLRLIKVSEKLGGIYKIEKKNSSS